MATGPNGPLTVVASPAVVPDEMMAPLKPPSEGQAVVGQALADKIQDKVLNLTAMNSLRLEVTGTFPAPTLLATHDVVWTSATDARYLLGLLPHQASDLAIHLFRREEEQAIQADLAAAFPWPVSITDRSTSALRHHTLATRLSGIAVVVCIPALLALLLIITGVVVDSNNRRNHWGLLLSMGWTIRDLVHLQVVKALIIGIPALFCGLASAYAAVFYPPAAGVTAFWMTGGERLPMVILNRDGVVITMLEIAAMIGLPYLAAVFLTCVRTVANDPWDLFTGGFMELTMGLLCKALDFNWPTGKTGGLPVLQSVDAWFPSGGGQPGDRTDRCRQKHTVAPSGGAAQTDGR